MTTGAMFSLDLFADGYAEDPYPHYAALRDRAPARSLTMTDCPFCAVESELDTAPPRERAHLTDRWRLTAHRSALPGWMLLIPRVHVGSLGELDDDATAELGPILRAAARMHTSEFGALKTYVMQFAEGVPHAHFSLVPRMPDQPTDRRDAASQAYNSVDEPLGERERDELARPQSTQRLLRLGRLTVPEIGTSPRAQPSTRRSDMRTLTLLLAFEPKAGEPAGEPPVMAVASGEGVVTVLDGDPADAGTSARYETSVQVTGETTFDETGTIVIGDRRFAMTTMGTGVLEPSPEGAPVMQGTVAWRLAGQGAAEGVTGTVVSNFVADMGSGQGTERQVARLFLP